VIEILGHHYDAVVSVVPDFFSLVLPKLTQFSRGEKCSLSAFRSITRFFADLLINAPTAPIRPLLVQFFASEPTDDRELALLDATQLIIGSYRHGISHSLVPSVTDRVVTENGSVLYLNCTFSDFGIETFSIKSLNTRSARRPSALARAGKRMRPYGMGGSAWAPGCGFFLGLSRAVSGQSAKYMKPQKTQWARPIARFLIKKRVQVTVMHIGTSVGDFDEFRAALGAPSEEGEGRLTVWECARGEIRFMRFTPGEKVSGFAIFWADPGLVEFDLARFGAAKQCVLVQPVESSGCLRLRFLRRAGNVEFAFRKMTLVVPRRLAVIVLRWVILFGVNAVVEYRDWKGIAKPEAKGRKSEWSELPDKLVLGIRFD
jgi:hypothetical protein